MSKCFLFFYSFCFVNKYVHFPLLYKGPIDPWTLTSVIPIFGVLLVIKNWGTLN